MPGDDKSMEILLQQQHNFTTNLLAQQQKWMQSMMEKFSQTSTSSSDHQLVPAFHAFNKEIQNWDSYLQQLNQHFSAYAVSQPEKQKSFFLSWIGTELFELLKNLFGSSNLDNKTFSELTGKLTEHFKIYHHIVAARYEFFKSEMKIGQTYKDWVADLRGLARDCKFVCNSDSCSASYVDEMIRDQIIVHTPHDAVRAATLQKQQATLADVIVVAESFEATTKTVAAMKNNNNETNVNINSVQNKNKYKKQKEINYENKLKSCSGCFRSHTRDKCKFRNATCNKCNKKGHISPVCMSTETKRNGGKKKNERSHNDVDNVETIFNISCNMSKVYIDLQIFNKSVKFQMDSGASISIINLTTYKLLNKPKLVKTKRILYGFGKKLIPILGELYTTVKCGKQEKEVIIIVVNTELGENLFGIDLFNKFGFQIQQVNTIAVTHENKVNELCLKYKDVFEPALGTVKDFKANIRLKPNANPQFFRSRQIPFAQMPKFKEEIERLTNLKIIKPIKFSQWASPIVLAQKPNNAIRICGDFKVAVNQQIEIEQYPLPTRESLLHVVRHGKFFSTIDLKDAYLQMELDGDSKQIMVINTPLGLFQYQRLPYGIASAPAIFQKYMEQLLNGIEGCANYIDDIIISAPTLAEHFERLERVLDILQSKGIKCKQQKCQFLLDNITYLGRRISSQGVLPDESGVAAVKDIKPPTNIKELEAFMGKANYYHNFVPNFSSIAAPINKLRKKNTPFVWETTQQHAFEQLKQHIINAAQLAHFQDDLPLLLATDASPFGIGAVISHLYPDGSERPIAFASKTLDQHQARYSQIEKEGLAIIFGVKRFHQYLYGRKFILITDHKPLVSIFNPNKHLPTMTAHRLQRWAITLMAYTFEIKYRKTSDHGNADALSRLPAGTDDNFDQEESCFNITFDDFPINAEQIRKQTENDPVLRLVRRYVEKSWPDKLKSQHLHIKPYFNRRESLTIQNDLLCLQTDFVRVVIPDALKQQTLKLLHDGHWGVVRMKQLARQHVWWNNIDNDITQLASKCTICKVENQSPPKEYQSWPDATKPWQRVHIDFAGPIFNSMWLICVDAFSQFPYVSSMSSTTTKDTISALTAIFSIEGIPDKLVSDNGPQLTSDEFKQFCSNLGIQHVTTAPFHPASNGLAERFVRSFKSAVRKNLDDNLPLKNAVHKYLSTYRFMPNEQGKSPAELMRGRPIKTIWSQLMESYKTPISSKSPNSKYTINQPVYIRYYGRGRKWIPGTIRQQLGKMLFVMDTDRGQCRRHINQMKPRSSTESHHQSSNNFNNEYSFHSTPNQQPIVMQQQPVVTQPQPEITDMSQQSTEEDQFATPTINPSGDSNSEVPRRSTRRRKEVSRYSPDIFRK